MNQQLKNKIKDTITHYPEWLEMGDYITEHKSGDYNMYCIAGFAIMLSPSETGFSQDQVNEFLLASSGEDISDLANILLDNEDTSLYLHSMWPEHLLWRFNYAESDTDRAKVACDVLDFYDDSKDSQARSFWVDLSDEAVDDDGNLYEDFYHFPEGTDRLEIWHYVEDTFDVSVIELMYGSKVEVMDE